MILTMLAALALVQEAPPPITPGTIAVRQPPATARGPSPESTFADAVEGALVDAGFTALPGAGADHARYVATVEIVRTARGAVRASGSSGPANVGGGTLGPALGGVVALPLGGGGKSAIGELVSTELAVKITRRGESQPAWEGRAITQQVDGTRGGTPAALAAKLAGALFRNFPSASGLTISVP